MKWKNFYSLTGRHALPKHVPNPMIHSVPPAKFHHNFISSRFGFSYVLIFIIIIAMKWHFIAALMCIPIIWVKYFFICSITNFLSYTLLVHRLWPLGFMFRNINMLFILYSFWAFAIFNTISFPKQLLLFKKNWGRLVLNLENFINWTMSILFFLGYFDSQVPSCLPIILTSWQEYQFTPLRNSLPQWIWLMCVTNRILLKWQCDF